MRPEKALGGSIPPLRTICDIIFKITNDFDECFYYGIHSTENLNDSYMGSGIRLWNAYRKYGIQHFKKEILEFFPDRESLSKRESEVVTEELIKDPNCYNIILGGDNCVSKGFVTARRIGTNEFELITIEEFEQNRTLYETPTQDKVCVYLKEDPSNFIWISKEEYYNNKEKYITPCSGKVLVKDFNEKCYIVSVNDSRIKTGELSYYWQNKHHSEETITKMKETFRKINHQQGEKNSRFNTIWIIKDGESKSIKKEELQGYLDLGWTKGRIIKDKTNIQKANQNRIWIHKGLETKTVYKSDLSLLKQYKENGWTYGRADAKHKPKSKVSKENKEFFDKL